MTTRREFLIGTGVGLLALGTETQAMEGGIGAADGPVVVSTWHHGIPANAAAWDVIEKGGRAVDAVETGVRVTEADPTVSSVGLGGQPDRDGIVTLDACIMDETGNAGSVAFLQNILHPVSVARKVMDESPHVMLAGEGALRFAREKGFPEQDLLTPQSRRDWEKWLETGEYKPWTPASDPNHDTISMLAIDTAGHLSGSCTTSGLAYKRHGRVGDSPIIGASLFVDNEVGAACATGVGEEVMKTVGSFLIVELMRQGMSAEEACREGVERIVRKNPGWRDIQVGYIALRRDGQVGSFAVQPGFQYALRDAAGNRLVDVGARTES